MIRRGNSQCKVCTFFKYYYFYFSLARWDVLVCLQLRSHIALQNMVSKYNFSLAKVTTVSSSLHGIFAILNASSDWCTQYVAISFTLARLEFIFDFFGLGRLSFALYSQQKCVIYYCWLDSRAGKNVYVSVYNLEIENLCCEWKSHFHIFIGCFALRRCSSGSFVLLEMFMTLNDFLSAIWNRR